MSRTLEIREAAEQEFNDAADWYYQEDTLASNRFIIAIEATLSKITHSPDSYPVVFGNEIRRAVVNKFPFSIFFTVDDEVVAILSIFHNSRNPMIWRGRE